MFDGHGVWDYLDKMDKNLLYLYASMIAKGRQNQKLFPPSNTGNAERDELLDAENRRKTAFYLVWFVYRWVLGCETLEQATKYANEETLKRYKLISLFRHNLRRIYVGIYGINEIYLYNYKKGDLDIVLEILYNRYDFLEQLECYIRKKQEILHKGFARSVKVLEETLQLMKGKPQCADILKRYYERNEIKQGEKE